MFGLALLLSAGLTFTVPAYSQAVIIQTAPPAARVEVRPANPGGGAIWTPGYYQWNPTTQSYDWQTGSWQVPPSRHMRWVPSHYIQQPDGTYNFYTGHWATRHQAHEEREAELKHER